MVHLDPDDYFLLFGAGASAEPGLPTAFAMTDRFKTVVADKNDELLTRSLALVLGGIQFLRGQQGSFPDAYINIEEVAETIDSLLARHRQRLSPFVGSWHEFIGEFDGSRNGGRNCLAELKDLLFKCLSTWLVTPAIGEIRHFQALGDFVREFGRLDIFTLNYDRCVEKALEAANISFTCGFDQSGWNSELFAQQISGVCIYKLHGSLDWYRDPEEMAIFSLQFPQEDRQPVADPDPMLIFGIPNKLTPTDPFLYLSHRFSERAKRAKVIAIIGYGFGDDYVNQIIMQGMSQDSRKKLVVVGKSATSAEKTFLNSLKGGETFIKAERVQFVDGGAKKTINDQSLLQTIKILVEAVANSGPF